MSSLRKAAPRRTHRERSQPQAREHMGLLEKKKDYLLRAQDYKKKKNLLLKLKQKAAFKNNDEFYLKMEKEKLVKGVHLLKNENLYDNDTIQLLKTQDQNYIQLQKSINRKKIEKLQNHLHIVEPTDDQGPSQNPNHIVFVEDEKDVKNFDLATHFDTIPAMANRPINRIRKSTLENTLIEAPEEDAIKKLTRQRQRHAVELASRLARDQKLAAATDELQLQRNLSGKGARRKVAGKTDANGLPVYKWLNRRKK
ncbi:small-subunit processome [Globomyces pollinis-pini]|nr:small-subunit processome [Globomyces pollinis-pini]